MFIYGSLRKGMYNHYLLEEAKAQLVATVRTNPSYQLVSLGSYPFMRKGSDTIVGEIYEVDENNLVIKRIADMEIRSGYKLEEIHLEAGAGVTGPVYGWTRELEPGQRLASWEIPVKSGDWVKHMTKAKKKEVRL